MSFSLWKSIVAPKNRHDSVATPARGIGDWLSRATLLIIFSLLISSISARAQYRFDHWTTDNGLPQNSIFGITQTRDGYLWMATGDGLVRFDGLRFTVFDQSNSKGLISNRFVNLYQDIDGSLWAGTEDSNLTRYHNGEFTVFTAADGLPNGHVLKIQADPDGGLLILTYKNWGQFRDGKYIAYPIAGNFTELQIYLGQSGTRWTWTRAGLTQSKNGTQTTYSIPLDQGDYINTLYEDSDGALWLTSIGFKVFRAKDGVVTTFTAKDGVPANRRTRTIYQDREGNIWFGTEGAGLINFKDGRFTTYAAEGLTGDVLAIFEDREGTLWIGTSTGGLLKLTRQFITGRSIRDGLPSNTIYPILQDRAGNIWVGTRFGVSHFSGDAFVNYGQGNSLPAVLDDVQSLYEDREGRLWVGNTAAIVYLKDGKVIVPPEVAGKIAGAVTINEDRHGTMWFGSHKGLFKLKDGQITQYTTSEGLPGIDVKIIYEDHLGNLWIGTYGGLAQFKDDHFISYTTKDGLGSNRVRAIFEDTDGVLWIGTYDGGLSRFKDGHITTYTTEHGLFNNGVFQILEDARANLWLSCNRGIYRVSKQQLNDFAEGKIKSLTCIAYGKQDGMLNTECNGGRQPAGIRTRDGKLWFPTMGGVVVIDADAVPFNRQPPPVLIEGVSLDNDHISFSKGDQIRPGQSSLEINYTGLSYVKPEQVQFRYKLIGQDEDWIEARTRRSVIYSHLQPGNYTFMVVAANSDGIWNDAGATLQITVLPPIWRTWWFISLSIVLAAGLIVFIYRRRVSQLRREKKAQEVFSQRLIDSQESERKRIAAELHDSLSQNLVIIKNRALHSLTMPDNHDRAIEQIEEIAEAANQSLAEVRAIAHNLRPFQIDRLGLTKAIDAMANKITATHAVNVKADLDVIDGLLSPEMEIHLYRIAQESLNNIIKHAAATEAQVTIRKTGQTIEITIQDNGKGFIPAVANGGGFGLLGITERARILGSVPMIQSSPGSGTRIDLIVPVNESKNAD